MSSEKRKASSGSDITSPSSHYVGKTIRTDRGEAISWQMLYLLWIDYSTDSGFYYKDIDYVFPRI